MNSDIPKGGIATPESPPSSTPAPQAEHVPTPAPSPSSPHPYMPAPYRYPTVQRPHERSGAHVAAWVIGGIVGAVVVASLLIALLAALVGSFVFSAIGQRELSATTTKTLAVSGAPSLVISDAAGNITIQQGGGSQVTVQVTKHAWGAARPSHRAG